MADGETIYSEKLGYKAYDVGYPLFMYHSYATSGKKISVTLEKDAESIRISGSDKGFTWSGMAWEDVKTYYEDVLSMFKENSFSW